MQEISENDVDDKILSVIDDAFSFEDDVGVISSDGKLKAAIISPEAYQFFLRKLEEEEDRLDSETVEEFRKSGEKYER